MSDLSEFRDDLVDQSASTRSDARLADPYSAPTSVGKAPRGLKLPRPPRLSAEWTILVGLVPYAASLVVSLYSIRSASNTTLALASDLVGLETIVYLSRTFWIGAGFPRFRMPTCLLSIAAVACTPGFHHLAGGDRWAPANDVGTLVHTFAVWGALCLAANAVLFAIGSRDVPSRGPRSGRPGRGFVPALVAAALLLGTAVPFALRPRMLAIEEFGSDIGPSQFLITFIVSTSALSLMTQTWRWGIRGRRRLVGWRLAVFVPALLASVAPLVFVVFAYYISDNPPPDGWADFLAVVGVAVAREIFIRWAGYRTINVYAERWRVRRRVLRARGSDSRIKGAPAGAN